MAHHGTKKSGVLIYWIVDSSGLNTYQVRSIIITSAAAISSISPVEAERRSMAITDNGKGAWFDYDLFGIIEPPGQFGIYIFFSEYIVGPSMEALLGLLVTLQSINIHPSRTAVLLRG